MFVCSDTDYCESRCRHNSELTTNSAAEAGDP
jgi:alpha-D-ribose 1-methylphosphonate 5-phosphate C-P lyase